MSTMSLSSSTIAMLKAITLMPTHTNHRAQVLVLCSAKLDLFLEGTTKSSEKTLKI
jgi:hypothetical protein